MSTDRDADLDPRPDLCRPTTGPDRGAGRTVMHNAALTDADHVAFLSWLGPGPGKVYKVVCSCRMWSATQTYKDGLVEGHAAHVATVTA